MRLSFQFVSRIALRLSFMCITLLLLHSCSHKISKDGATLPPIIKAHAASQKYNMQLDFMKHHLSGMLIVRRMPNEEIRFLAEHLRLFSSGRNVQSKQLYRTNEEREYTETVGE